MSTLTLIVVGLLLFGVLVVLFLRWRLSPERRLQHQIESIRAEIEQITTGVLPEVQKAGRMHEIVSDTLTMYERIVKALPMAIIAADPDERGEGRITFVNEYGARMLGYTASELIGQPLSIVIPEQTRQQQAGAFVKAANSGIFERRPFNVNALKKDGTTIIIQHIVGTWHDADGVHFVAAASSLER